MSNKNKKNKILSLNEKDFSKIDKTLNSIINDTFDILFEYEILKYIKQKDRELFEKLKNISEKPIYIKVKDVGLKNKNDIMLFEGEYVFTKIISKKAFLIEPCYECNANILFLYYKKKGISFSIINDDEVSAILKTDEKMKKHMEERLIESENKLQGILKEEQSIISKEQEYLRTEVAIDQKQFTLNGFAELKEKIVEAVKDINTEIKKLRNTIDALQFNKVLPNYLDVYGEAVLQDIDL